MVQTSIVAKTDTASAAKPAPLPSPTQSLDFSRPHFLSGIEALALLPVIQRVRDEAAGLNTAGFISGYRGSPLGGLDQTLWEQKERLEAFHITFQPGINEDLAATAIWGTQQVGLFQGAKYDGVYSLWYGKGPGVDRSMDVFKHANAAGTSQFGGVLAVAGDDHGAKSSTLPHQSEHMFAAAMMPVLNPAGVQDYIDFGIHGWAMSRYSGCWIGLKATADTVESSASIIIDPHRIKILLPGDELPLGGLNIRWPDAPMDQEYRLQRYKGYAAMSYARMNGLNRIVMDSPRARLGIITTGKAYLDVRQALDDLGIDEALAREIGLRVLKVGMSWPLNSEDVHDFAQGLEEVLVVEEKRQLIEYQLKEQLYNWGENVRPKVIGKYDDKGEWTLPHVSWQLPAAGELSPSLIARVVAGRLGRFYTNERIAARVAMIEAKERALTEAHLSIPRTPHFCSGCPHNTSTLSLPEGSRALAGIGCHYMALWLDDGRTQTFSQMGGEGVAWVGQAPFTETGHVFANLGDGTYTHSGILAIRQAVSSGVSMTYKILYNDAVAMTGGQPLEQGLTVPAITRQLAAEGVVKLVVVSDQPEKYDGLAAELAPGTTVHHRRELDSVQRTLRDIKGVTALVYDQTCAAEKRRRRRKGEYPDPLKRVFINDRVCEGCGDCSAKSNCMSVVGVETDYGPKRAIDQSSCNKDFSCSDGFCPSFVTIHGGKPRRGKAMAGGDQFGDLPEPKLPDLTKPYNILVTGVGGTGVVTIGAVIGRAAADEGRGVTVLDMAGLAQKGGPVWSHIRVAPKPEDLQATRIAMGEADVIIGCDEVVAIADDSLSRMQAGRTHAVINSDVSITSDIVRRFRAQGKTGDVVRFNDPDARARDMERQIVDTVGVDGADFIAATRLATKLMGDSIATNAFMLGYVWQKGLLPVGHAALMTAIEIQGVAVSATKAAFLWGRRAAHDRAGVEAAALPPAAKAPVAETLEAFIARRAEELTRYQDEAYARRYTKFVQEVAARETQVARGSTRLGWAVARGYYKLLAYKDEYEVARLMIDPAFKAKLAEAFEGDYKVSYNLAPPLLSKPDPVTGKIQKREFGPWLEPAFRILAQLKGLRGTSLDIFGYSKDRKLDRRLIADYEATVAHILGGLNPGNLDSAVALAEMPNDIRGYGHVKETYVANARKQADQLKARFDQTAATVVLAAE